MLALGSSHTRLTVKIGFLHLVEREAGELREALSVWPDGPEPEFRKVEVLHIGGRSYYAWQEAVERQVDVGAGSATNSRAAPNTVHIFRPARAGAPA